jgi:hypothetical protein
MIRRAVPRQDLHGLASLHELHACLLCGGAHLRQQKERMFKRTKEQRAFTAALGVVSALGNACSDGSGDLVRDAGASYDASSADAAASDDASSKNACPVISSATLAPTVVMVGDKAQVALDVSDPDNGPLPLSYSFLQTGGAIQSVADIKTPAYLCIQAGMNSFSYSVSDGLCAKSGMLPVQCIDRAGDAAGVAGLDGGIDGGRDGG